MRDIRALFVGLAPHDRRAGHCGPDKNLARHRQADEDGRDLIAAHFAAGTDRYRHHGSHGAGRFELSAGRQEFPKAGGHRRKHHVVDESRRTVTGWTSPPAG